jgi:hypothetical protein
VTRAMQLALQRWWALPDVGAAPHVLLLQVRRCPPPTQPHPLPCPPFLAVCHPSPTHPHPALAGLVTRPTPGAVACGCLQHRPRPCRCRLPSLPEQQPAPHKHTPPPPARPQAFQQLVELRESARVLLDLQNSGHSAQPDAGYADLKDTLETWRCARGGAMQCLPARVTRLRVLWGRRIRLPACIYNLLHPRPHLTRSPPATKPITTTPPPPPRRPQAAHAQRVGAAVALAGRAHVAQHRVQHSHQRVQVRASSLLGWLAGGGQERGRGSHAAPAAKAAEAPALGPCLPFPWRQADACLCPRPRRGYADAAPQLHQLGYRDKAWSVNRWVQGRAGGLGGLGGACRCPAVAAARRCPGH